MTPEEAIKVLETTKPVEWSLQAPKINRAMQMGAAALRRESILREFIEVGLGLAYGVTMQDPANSSWVAGYTTALKRVRKKLEDR